ncbi:TIGR01777 family oxidoreductase [Pseudalkalibacillus berkeleyi]|uniref:TIGR01777 family oxidoreductase n=1 Tax=Pseudalkalibacillus berkeleyi TaxID=1069813 RepID=A0ABS9H2Y4_9BACL|nr:TIGR01777 family oxidoreductase [Pseudalkalibacillus berkeleyi]MCF6139307.1 TIGR01777 family oxidoreductase [Pseudalkalibacillus berkeleyi]
MKIAISGGTGFVGAALTDQFIKQNHHVYVLTRNPTGKPEKENVTYIEWMHDNGELPTLSGIDAFINLAGETINGRWTDEKKEKILSSRIHATREILKIIERMESKPKVLINASAIGYYGTSKSKTFDEHTSTSGDDFLAHVTAEWEKEAMKAEQNGVRVVRTRFGLILAKNEGALPRMTLPYKLYVGGPIGSGKQWYSWIHINDVVGMIDHALNDDSLEGAVNATSPHPVQMDDFGKILAKTLNRPHWLPLPAFVLQIGLGEMSTLILEGQKVVPRKALDHQYKFMYPTLSSALAAIFDN